MFRPRLNYKRKKEIWDPLVSSDSDISIFESYKDLFVLAACTGFINNKRKSLPKSGKKGEILWEHISKENKMALDCLALAETSDLSVLIDSDNEHIKKKIKIAEEYANGGIEIIKNLVLEKPGSPLDNLIGYINKISKLERKEGYLEELEEEF